MKYILQKRLLSHTSPSDWTDLIEFPNQHAAYKHVLTNQEDVEASVGFWWQTYRLSGTWEYRILDRNTQKILAWSWKRADKALEDMGEI